MLSLPYVIGYHWFQWMDQPFEGRAAGGENQWIGVVDIDDDLRVPLADAMREVNAGLIERRLGLARR